MASFGYPPGPGYQAPYPPAPQARQQMPSSKVELHVSCNGLRKMDVTSHSDPQAVLHMYDKVVKKWTEVFLQFSFLRNTISVCHYALILHS